MKLFKILINYWKNPLYRNSFYLIFNMIISAGSGFFFWILATKFYSSAEVGLGSALISATALLYIFTLFGMDISIIRFIESQKQKKEMINTAFTLTAILAFLLSIILLGGIKLWSPALVLLYNNWIYVLSFVIFGITGSLFELQSNVFVGFREAKYAFFQSIITLSRLIFLPLIVSLGAFGIYLSAGLSYMIAFIVGNILILKVYSIYRPKITFNKNIFKKMFNYSFTNYIANIFFYLPNVILPIIVINVLGVTMNAYFFIAWKISFILNTIAFATSRSLLAEGSFSPSELKINVFKSLKFILILLIPAIIILIIFGRTILLIFSPEYSLYSYNLLITLSIGSIPYSINIVYTSIKRVKKQIRSVILVFGITTCITVISGFFLMPIIGIVGVGYAWIFSNTLVLLGVLFDILLNGVLFIRD